MPSAGCPRPCPRSGFRWHRRGSAARAARSSPSSLRIQSAEEIRISRIVAPSLSRNWKFEFIPLQRGVMCELNALPKFAHFPTSSLREPTRAVAPTPAPVAHPLSAAARDECDAPRNRRVVLLRRSNAKAAKNKNPKGRPGIHPAPPQKGLGLDGPGTQSPSGQNLTERCPTTRPSPLEHQQDIRREQDEMDAALHDVRVAAGEGDDRDA
jgi:hypothetical protein